MSQDIAELFDPPKIGQYSIENEKDTDPKDSPNENEKNIAYPAVSGACRGAPVLEGEEARAEQDHKIIHGDPLPVNRRKTSSRSPL
jgi:hypothetical protein